MGCSESKDVKKISVSAANKKLEESVQNLEVVRISSASSETSDLGSSNKDSMSSGAPNTPDDKQLATDEDDDEVNEIPNNYDSIPVCDLGESLDARRMTGLWNQSGMATSSKPNSSSAMSNNSSDSGIYDLDEDYSFVITENSPAELIRKVENEFTPIENLDLTITGKACPRLLSGTQKARQEEQQILQGLREEGFIATSRQRAGGGVSFDIIEATPATESAGSNKFKPKDFLPESHRKHLEEQRTRFHGGRSSADVQRKMAEAQERRKQALEAKKDTLNTKKQVILEEQDEELKVKHSQKVDAAMQKREAHLKELRDKLKAQNKRAQNIKLKKLINGPPVPVPVPVGGRPRMDVGDDFFD